MYGFDYSTDFTEFAKEVVWFGGIEQQGDKYPFLAFLMAKGMPEAYEHARKVFGFTDEDFRQALRQAKAGLFVYEEEWLEWNKKLGIEPALPFPKKVWFS